MKIQIEGCEGRKSFLKEMGIPDEMIDELTWYRNHIGSVFGVRKVGGNVYFLDKSVAKYATVDKADAKVLG